MRKFLRVGASSVMTAPASGPSHGSGVAPALWYAKRHSSTRASRATAAALVRSSSAYGSPAARMRSGRLRSEEHTSELQSHSDLVCRLLLEKKKNKRTQKI